MYTGRVSLAAPMRQLGQFYKMGADVAVGLVRTRFQVQEFLEQSWMIARVSLVPTVLVAVPFTVLVSFTLNILLREIGAADLSGAGAALGAVTQVGPVVTVLIVAGAGATAIAADLGSRTIREEIDAMEALAIRPIPYLVTTRLMASVVAVVPLYLLCLALNYVAVKVVIGLSGGVSTGTYEHYFRLVLSATDIGYSLVKAVVFVIITSTIQCYYGFFASGGPQGVGTAAGRAMRASISAMIVVNLLLTVAFWGIGSGARLGG